MVKHYKPDDHVEAVKKIEGTKPTSGAQNINPADYADVQDVLDSLQQRLAQHGLLPMKKTGEATPKEIVHKEDATKETFKDQFKTTEDIAKLVKSTEQKMSTASAYQSFKLVGTDFVVRDFRDGVPEEALAKKSKADKLYDDKVEKARVKKGRIDGTFELKDGELKELKKGSFSVYSDRSDLSRAGVRKEGTIKSLRRMLTNFEKLLVERFEQGIEIIKKLIGKDYIFTNKDTAQWREFFSKFKSRTVSRKIKTKDIKQFVFRDLLSSPDKGHSRILIADMIHASGKIEKFVRLRMVIKSGELIKKFSAMPSGEFFDMDLLAGELGEEFSYNAITYKGEFINYGTLPSKGKFMSDKVEREVAEHLGISIDKFKKKS